MTAETRQLALNPALGRVDDVDLAVAYNFPDGVSSWLRATFVSSVDGAATLDGRSGGLGNATDQRIFALSRAAADVVLVGAGTVRVEGYGPAEESAEWRTLRGSRPPTPPVAVVSRCLDLDLSAPLFTDAPSYARTLVLTTED
ncbi:MAG: dihydrofolate reductase family protein, partial [Solirubrobacteraceae bacterium]